MTLPLTIESLVAVLLLATILYCIRLNAQLKRLKADEAVFRTTIAELVGATEKAERAAAGLKVTVREAEQALSERLRDAEQFTIQMGQQLEAGSEILSRVTQIAGARNPAPVKPQPKPAPAPDPKAIMAAAQAFTDRNRARVKGIAA